MSRVVALACLLVVATFGGSVRADPSRSMNLALSYRVPDECMSAGEFLGRLAEHLAAGGENGLLSSRVIVQRVDGLYEMAMQFNGGYLVYIPPHESCDELLHEAILEAGMARKKVGNAIDLAFFLTVARDRRLNPQVAAPAETAAATVALEQPAAPLRPRRSSEVRDRPGPRSVSEPDEPPVSMPQYSLLYRTAVDFGALPKPSLGLGLVASVGWRSARFSFGITRWTPQLWDPWGDDPYSTTLDKRELELLSASLSGCSPLVQHGTQRLSVSVLTCVRGGLYRLHLPQVRQLAAGTVHASSLGGQLGVALRGGPFWGEFTAGLDNLWRGKAFEHVGGQDAETGEPIRFDTAFELGQTRASVGFQLGWAFDFEPEPAASSSPIEIPAPASAGVVAQGGSQ